MFGAVIECPRRRARWPVDAAFGGDFEAFRVVLDKSPDCLLGHAVAVGVCGVEKIHAQIKGLGQGGVAFFFVGRTIGPGKTPTPQANGADHWAGIP